jgi:UDP-N-acetylmuramoyl-L-alanyl-D-glutamate--2,6-diaminopimelate ligase
LRVSKIQEHFPELIIAGNFDTDFSGITLDSRKVKSGDMFVAIKGSKLDSHTKIYEAFDNGAVGVVIEKDMIIPEGKFKIITDNSRKTYALISSLYFDFPSKRLKLIGITGTSGKTTTAFLMYKLFNLMNLKAGFIGTIGVGKGDFFTVSETFPPTTPDAFPLNSMLS